MTQAIYAEITDDDGKRIATLTRPPTEGVSAKLRNAAGEIVEEFPQDDPRDAAMTYLYEHPEEFDMTKREELSCPVNPAR